MKDLYYTNKIKRLERISKIETVICIILIVILSIAAFLYLREYERIKVIKVNCKCTGYTIIDRDSVIWCDGRRIKYDSHKTLTKLHEYLKQQNRKSN